MAALGFSFERHQRFRIHQGFESSRAKPQNRPVRNQNGTSRTSWIETVDTPLQLSLMSPVDRSPFYMRHLVRANLGAVWSNGVYERILPQKNRPILDATPHRDED